jgi:SAM-dependent methyltransferase/3-polyprenyl-4-hydroxybenzoate decarboxylase
MSDRWIRDDAALVVRDRDAVTVVGRGGAARRFPGASADLVCVALDLLSEPRTEADLAEALRGLAGECEPALVAETVAVLRDAGAIRVLAGAVARPIAASARARIVVGVSGAVAATDAPALVRMLLARGFEVAVTMTAAAARFVSADTLEAITHRPVVRGFWQRRAPGPAPHIHLAAWADLIVLYPATAATIARVAHGACSDVLSATAAAASRPLLVVPSMNESMYRSAAVQRNIERLREDGHSIVQPVSGLEVAWEPSARVPAAGAAPSPAHVAAAIELLLRDSPEKRAVAPVPVEAWNRQYESGPAAALPWFTEELDPDLAEELRAAGKGRLVDVGTGPGTAAIFAARSGFGVVATDLSPAALSVARERAGDLPIVWIVDDVLDSRLWGQFDVAIDRGCLHCLPRSAWPKYAEALRRWVAPGGKLLLKVHAPEELGRHGTHPASAEEIAAVFSEGFSVAKVRPSEFEGTVRPAPKALLAVLERRSSRYVEPA